MRKSKTTKILKKTRILTNFDDYERLVNLNSYEAREILLHINDLEVEALNTASREKMVQTKGVIKT